MTSATVRPLSPRAKAQKRCMSCNMGKGKWTNTYLVSHCEEDVEVSEEDGPLSNVAKWCELEMSVPNARQKSKSIQEFNDGIDYILGSVGTYGTSRVADAL